MGSLRDVVSVRLIGRQSWDRLAEFCGRYLGKRVDLPGRKLALARLNDSTKDGSSALRSFTRLKRRFCVRQRTPLLPAWLPSYDPRSP